MEPEKTSNPEEDRSASNDGARKTRRRSKRGRRKSSTEPTNQASAVEGGQPSQDTDDGSTDDSQESTQNTKRKRSSNRSRSSQERTTATTRPGRSSRATNAKQDVREQESAQSTGSDSAAPTGDELFETADDELGTVQESTEIIEPTESDDVADKEVVGGEKIMVINVAPREESRIAVLANGQLEELYTERASAESQVGNIYKGRIANVEPSIQAAFVDFGEGQNGFLHISDLQPQYFPNGSNGQVAEEVGRKTARKDRPPIQKCLKRGQAVIVQIIKDGIGTKGPTLSTYISLPGRFLVMMPGMKHLGVSRKVLDEEVRRKTRDLLTELDPPKDFGFIVRTAGAGRTKTDLRRDLHYLQRLWKTVARRIREAPAPCELYTESDLVIRTIRDIYGSDISRIVVDNDDAAQRVREFLQICMPRSPDCVEQYRGQLPLFHRYGVEQEIDDIHARHVDLASGGSIVIDQTEALVAIDVNSGKYREQEDAEQTALKINMEAAAEIPRQLRIRDMGGVIVIDFIDMRLEKNRRTVERALRDAMKKDRARSRVLRISQFGIVEMTRQRLRPSLRGSIFQDCPHCHGAGQVKSAESVSLDVMRSLKVALDKEETEQVEVNVSTQVAFDIQNRKRHEIAQIELDTGKRVVIRGDAMLGLDEVSYRRLDRNDRQISARPGRQQERR
jgi:ribonuclease E